VIAAATMFPARIIAHPLCIHAHCCCYYYGSVVDRVSVIVLE
jgi:hypothetical protein